MSDPNNPSAQLPQAPPAYDAPMAPMAPMAPVGPQYAQPVAPVGPAPKPVANAAMLMLVSAALGLIGIIVSFANKSALRTTIAKKNPSFDTAKLNTAVNAGLASAAVFGIIFIALYIWLSRQVLKGKNWARIVTLIIAALGVLFGLVSLGTTVPAVTRVFDLVAALVDLAVVVLLLQKPSIAFFRRAR